MIPCSNEKCNKLLLPWTEERYVNILMIYCEQDSSKMDILFTLKPNSRSIIHSKMSLTNDNTLGDVHSIENHVHLPLEVEEINVGRNAQIFSVFYSFSV
jgi:hypothetical protein